MAGGRVVIGFDTETFEGNVKVLASSTGDYLETSDTEDLFDFLYRTLENTDADFGVFWNLGFDFGAIAKPYVVAHAEELRQQHYRAISARRKLSQLAAIADADGLNPAQVREMKALLLQLDGMETIEIFDTVRYHVRYVGGKGVGLKPRGKGSGRKKTRWCFDAAVFYQEGRGSMSLEAAASKYLGQHKNAEELGISREAIGTQAGYYESHREAIIKYCIQDSKLPASLMDRTIAAFETLGVPFPDRPFSKGSVSKAILEANGCMDATQRRYERLDKSAWRGLWNKAFQGGVFLIRIAGHDSKCYQLDINSAYPDALRRFPSLEDAEVVGPTDPRFPQCFFRFYRIRAAATPRLPLKERRSLRKIYGWDPQPRVFVVTGPDLDALDAYGDPYVIEEAVGIWTPPNAPRPFDWLNETFRQKDEAKKTYGGDSVEYLNIKIVANGVYGCVAQRRPRPSRFTNLIYASYTTALCRKELWLRALRAESSGDKILQYATDGLLIRDQTEGRHRKKAASEGTRDLGGWSFEDSPPVTIFETGVYVVHAQPKPKLKRRGFPDLDYDTLRQVKETIWTSKRKSPIKLKQGIIHRRTAEIGIFLPVERSLNPAKAVRDAGMSAPEDFWGAPLSRFFERCWDLKLKGER